jgi:hypothetical protein
VVECDGFENRYTGNGIGGSNPPLSTSLFSARCKSSIYDGHFCFGKTSVKQGHVSMENQEQIERRTYVGEMSTQAFDGFAGFRLDQSYQLRYTRLGDGNVRIELDHAPNPGRQLVVNEGEFARWWVKNN